jgi:alkanesulfonate monooxygenase SsuD/methylene tetrahydromethanopterin reductase-like flavin-dependent oxidoreductase (luciferase family)
MRFDAGLHAHAGDISEFPNIEEWRDQARFCEDAGFTGMWSAEHHFCWDGWTTPTPTNPVMIAAYLCAETERIRFGQTGVAINDWHPLRLAEDIATLDHMSGGRVDFGFMRGLNNRVNGNFNPLADRRNFKQANALMWESLEVVKKAWTGQPFRHQGEFYQIPMPGWKDESEPADQLDPAFYGPDGELIALAVPPTPVQKPTPPIWLMADSVGSHQEAARKGVNVVCWGRSFKAIKESWDAYRAAEDPSPGPGRRGRLAVMRSVYVAPTSQQAEAVMRPAINGLFDHMGNSTNPAWGRKGLLASDEELTSEDLDCDWFDYLRRIEWAIAGSPDQVAESLARFEEELGMDHLVQYWSVHGLTARELRRSQELFAEHVMPRFSRDPISIKS